MRKRLIDVKTVLALAALLLLSTCENVFQVGLGDQVDVDAPVVSLTSHQPGSYIAGALTFSGVAEDDKGITSLEISFDGGASWSPVATIDASASRWNHPFDTTARTDGRLRVILRGADEAGKVTVTDELVFSIDNTPPVLLVTGPRDYGTRSFNTLATLDVAASDVHPLKIFGVEVTDATGRRLGDVVEVEQAASPWSFVFQSADYYPDGYDPFSGNSAFRFRFRVYAEDDAGNRSTVFYHTDDVRSLNNQQPLTVDQLAAILHPSAVPNASSVGGSASVSASALAGIALGGDSLLYLDFNESLDRPQISLTQPNIKGSQPYTVPMNGVITGSVRDDDAIAAAYPLMKLWRDGDPEPSTWTPLRGAGDTSTPEIFDFEYDLPDDQAGSYRLSILVQDVNGVESSIDALSVIITSGAPTLDIAAPSSGSFQRGTITIEGTAAHEAGAPTVDLSFDDGVTYDPLYSTTADGADEWSFSVDTTGFADGSYTFRVRATSPSDVENSESLSITIDNTAPSLTITGPTENQNVNGTFALRGTSDDNIQVAQVHYLDPSDGTTWVLFEDGGTPELYSWSADIDSTALAEGPLSLSVRVTDRSGNQFTAARNVNVVQTGDLPGFSVTNVDIAGDFADNVFTGQATLLGSVSDDDWIDASSLELRSRTKASLGDAWSAWGAWGQVSTVGANAQVVDFQHSFTGAIEGYYEFQLRVSDSDEGGRKLGEAPVTAYLPGGSAPDADGVRFVLDSAPPTLTISSVTGGVQTGGVVVTREDLTFAGTATDTMGVSEVQYRLTPSGDVPGPWSDATTTPALLGPGVDPVSWDVPLAVAGLSTGEYSLEIRAVDGAGKQVVQTRQLVVDKQVPTISLDEPVAGIDVNGSVTIRGVSDDNSQVARSYYLLQPAADPVPVTLPSVAGDGTDIPNGWTPFASAYGWSAAWDSYAYQQSVQGNYTPGDYTVYVVARDTSGNTSTLASATVTIDQSTDRPVLTLTNLTDPGQGVPSPVGTQPGNLLTGSGVITGTLSDDDGVDGAAIEVRTQTYDWGSTSFGAWGAWQQLSAATGGSSYAGVRTSGSFTYDVPTALGEGIYRIQIRAIDVDSAGTGVYGDGNDFSWQQIGQIEFAYDAGLPALALDPSPADGSFHAADFGISGTASDSNGIHIVEVNDGSGFAAASLGAGTWTFSAPVASDGTGDGTFTYTVRATDRFGRTREVTRGFTRDATDPPAPTIDAFGSSYFVNELVVSGSASDPTSGVAAVEYSFDQSTWTGATGTTSWFRTIDISASGANLAEGSDTIYARTLDRAGNISSSASRSFVVDRLAPSLTETASGIGGTGTVYRNADVALGGAATDANGVVSVVVTSAKDGGAPAGLLNDTVDDGVWATTLPVSGGEGAYQVVVTSEDSVGRTASLTRNIVFDTTSPDLTITAPTAGELVVGTAYTIRGQVTDNGGKGVTGLEYSTDGTNWTNIPLSGLNWSVVGVDLSTGGEGSRTLYVRATDGLNAPVTETVTFNYDVNPPVLTETTVATSAEQITATDTVYDGTATDTNALSGLAVATNGGAPVAVTVDGGGTWTYTHVAGADGSYELVFTATDVAGRTTSLTRRVYVDRSAPPAPTIDAFTGSYQVNELVASGTSSDGESGVGSVAYSFDDATWITATGTTSWFRTIDIGGTGANLAEGNHTLYVRAIDRAGNASASATRGFTVDRNNPTLTVEAAYDGIVYRNGAFTIAGTVADSLPLGASPVSVSVVHEGVSPVALGAIAYDGGTGAWSQNVPVPEGDGAYTVTITAGDAVGRTSQAIRTVTVDSSPPPVAISNIASDGSTRVDAASYTVSGTAGPDTTGLTSVEYSLNGGAWTAASGTTNWNVPLAGLADGLNQTFAIRGTDGAGNVSTPLSYDFDVDLAAPSLAITGGNTVAGTTYLSGDVTLSGTTSDANGVSSVVVAYSLDGAAAVQILNDIDGNGTWTVTHTPGSDGEYVFTVTATDAVGKQTALSRTVRVDSVNPNAEFTSLTPVVGTNTVNGKITVRAAIADDIALDTTEWAIVPFGVSPGGGDYLAVSGSKTAPLFDIDTTITVNNVVVNSGAPASRTLADGATSTLWLRATDRAGNATVISQDLIVDQASDLPAISFTTIDETADTAGESASNLIESDALVRFVVTDDDLVDVSTLQVSIGDASSWVAVNHNGGAVPADAKSVNTNHNLYLPSMLPEGTTMFYLRVSDEASAKAGLSAVQQQVGPIYVMVDRNFPTLTETALGGDVFRSALFSLSGSVGDTNALASLTITESVNAGAAVEITDTALSGTSDTWSRASLPTGGVADGSYEYVITVVDASGKQTILNRTVTIDTTAPTAPVVTDPVADEWLGSGTHLFTGTSDDGAGSGVESLYWREAVRGAGAPAIGDPAWTEATVAPDGSWSVAVAIGGAGLRDFYAYTVDAAGNVSPVTTRQFGLDQAPPAVAVNGGSGTQYENGDFTIAGTFSDTAGLSGIAVETSTDNVIFSAANPAAAVFDGGAGTWTWDRIVGAQPDGTYYYRFTFTDLAGNQVQLTKTLNLDSSPPAVTFDATTPSINFDGGAKTATANGTMVLAGSISEDQGTANLASLEYRVGGGSWNALALNGTFSISGIDTTSYPDLADLAVDVRVRDRNGNETTDTFTLQVDQATNKPVVAISSPADGATVTSISVSVSGTATDDDGITTAPGSVEYRFSEDAGATWGPWTNITTTGVPTSRSFTFNLASGSDGAKALEFRALDNGGVSSDVVALALTFDTLEPEISGLAPAEGSYQTGDFSVTGTVSDDSGVVESLEYRVLRDGVEIQAWAYVLGPALGAASSPFSQVIDTSAGTGEYQIFLRAIDDGALVRSQSLSVFVDKSAPAVAFSNPTGGSTQNNIITLSGTSGDNYGVSSVDFYAVDVNNGNAEMALPTGTPAGTTSWSISGFDTRNATLLSYASDLGGGVYELTLRAVATDLAGNTTSTAGGSDLVFQIDQATDRPVITFDDIATDGSSTLTSGTVRGTVSDDDGVASITVDIYAVDNSFVTETVTLTSGSYGQTDVAWRVNLSSLENGVREIRVQATDTVNNDPNSSTDTGRIDFALDTENPDLAVSTPAANITWSAANSFTLTGTAADETGITALAYKIDDNDFSGGTVAIPDTDANGWQTWTFTIPQGDLANGAHTIYVQATDSVGNTRIASRQLSVDKTAPSISITSPANGEAVFGPLTIGGTTSDNPGGAGVASVSVGLGRQINPGDLAGSTWTAVPGTTSWSFSFLNINDYANTTYSFNTGDTDEDGIEDGGETWTDIWNFTFYVRATDAAGDGADPNTAYLTTYTLQIDPKRDRPEVTILSPSDGSTVGGFVRVFGSSFDSQFVEKVQIAIDANNDGDYTNDAWAEGSLDETDAGVNWYLAAGTTSWSVNLNENGEFDPSLGSTRTIAFKVRAKDYKLAPGDGIYGAEVEYSITFNKDFPQFGTLSIASGVTVGGIVTLSGLVRDETDVQRIIFSNEGPLLNNTVIFNNPGGLQPVGAANVDVSSAAAISAGMSVELLGTSDPDYDAAFPGSYRINIPIDTEAPGLYPGGAGSMSVKVTAEDTTTPSPFTNQQLISFSVDNVNPSDLTYTGNTEIVGTAAELQGTVRDTGTVSGIDRIVVYMTNAAGEIVRLKNASGSLAGFLEADVLDAGNAAYDDYRMIIDNRLEEGNDGGAAGDNDGIAEFLTLSAGVYNWSGLFNSTLVGDGVVTIHYLAEDQAGNTASGTTAGYVANNKPAIDSIVLGTDLNGDGDVVDAGEQTTPITTGFAATGYTARNNRLYIGITASGGNGTLRYSVLYLGVEQNAVLTGSTLIIDTSGFADSALANDRSFEILVYDSTTSDDADSTDELSDTVTVNLSIDNIDDVAPTVAIAPFGQTWSENADDAAKVLGAVGEYNDNIAMNGTERLGHVEYATDSPFDGADADISGRIIFRGKVEDNQRVSRMSATIAGYDGGNGPGVAFDVYDASGAGALSATDWAFEIDGTNYLTDAQGNVFNWTFEWNTAALASVVARNVAVTFTVYDANGTPNTATDSMTVDVVPYITGLETPNLIGGGIKERNIRSALGYYSVKTGATADFITVTGFNLNPIVDGVRIANSGFPAALDAGTPVGEIIPFNAPTADYTSFTMSNAATGSGYLVVLGGTDLDPIPSVNNVNDIAAAYNQEPDPFVTKNTMLSDDRYIRFFTVETTAYASEGVTYPAMYMNGDNPEFAYADNNAASGSGVYETLKRNGVRVARGWQYSQVAVAEDADGNFYQVSITDNSGSNAGGLHLFFNQYATGGAFTDGWAYPEYAGYAGIRSFNTNNNAIFLDHLKYDGDLNGDDNFLRLNRFVNPSLVVTGGAATTARIYLAYFDTRLGELAFRNFTIGQDVAAGTIPLTGGNDTNQPNGQPTNNTDSTPSGRQLVTASAGEYFDMVVTSTGVVVIAYYDQAESRLELVYSTEIDGTTPRSLDGSNPTAALYWSTPLVIGDLYEGTYVSMDAHTDDSLHIAAYDSSLAGLSYFYLSDFADTTPAGVKIDTNNSVGIWADILVAADGTPYIGYYNNSENGTRDSLKIAWALHDTSAALQPGVDASGFVTGEWEFATVPAGTVPQGGIPQFNGLHLGLRSDGMPVVGYLGGGIEYSRPLPELP